MPTRLDAFIVVLFLVLQAGLVLVSFLGMLSRHLGRRLRLPAYLALGIQWLVLLGFATFMLGWVFGLLSLVLSPVYAFLVRRLADRYAERLRG